MNGFGKFLTQNAESMYPKLRLSVESLLGIRRDLIQQHLTMQTDTNRARLEKYLEDGIAILEGKHIPIISIESTTSASPRELDLDLNEEDTGYSYDVLFGPYVADASRIDIKEPYLRLKYQLDNFNHFCSLIARSGNVKKVELTTGTLDEDDRFYSDSYLEDISRRLKEDHSIEFNWRRDSNLHAREIRTDGGWVILSDRGLDIYKKPESRNEFGYFDLALRKCKQTKVHIRREL